MARRPSSARDPRRSVRAAAAGLGLGALACGGGAPLLHPAHALPAGGVTAGAGFSQRFAVGEASSAQQAAARLDPAAANTEGLGELARGAVAQALFAPGLAPWAGARAGLGQDLELGLTASGRSLRLDARRAYGGDVTALSLGLALSSRVPLSGAEPDRSGAIAGLDDRGVGGLALELPLLVGYRSSGDVVTVWAGLRPGLETLRGPLRFVAAGDTELETTLHAHRIWLDGILGAMVGLHPLWVGLELDFGYVRGAGRWEAPTPTDGSAGGPLGPLLAERSGPLDGFTFTPAAVLRGRFD